MPRKKLITAGLAHDATDQERMTSLLMRGWIAAYVRSNPYHDDESWKAAAKLEAERGRYALSEVAAELLALGVILPAKVETVAAPAPPAPKRKKGKPEEEGGLFG